MKKATLLVALASAFTLASGVATADDGRTVGGVVDDTAVTAKVKAALIADPVTKAHQISVDTYQGAVKLSGFVETAEAKVKAVEIASGIEGTASVDDSLEVRP